MTCPTCQTEVPDESLFCLRCGARLRVPAERTPPNGGGTTSRPSAAPTRPRPAPRPGPVASGPAPAPSAAPPPGGKQPYTLSFKALSDERLRYRVARWVCEVAPAHPISEVQEGLTQGAFATFLALTDAEAAAARQRIEALGAHPALWRLQPASPAELLLPARSPQKARKAEEWSPGKKIAAVAIGLLAIFLFGAFAAQRYYNAQPTGPQPGTMPRIGGTP